MLSQFLGQCSHACPQLVGLVVIDDRIVEERRQAAKSIHPEEPPARRAAQACRQRSDRHPTAVKVFECGEQGSLIVTRGVDHPRSDAAMDAPNRGARQIVQHGVADEVMGDLYRSGFPDE
jgi:hypothetical protein